MVYPAVANFDEKARATKACTEHTATKIRMGLLGTLPVMSREYLDELEHVRGACPRPPNARLTRRRSGNDPGGGLFAPELQWRPRRAAPPTPSPA